MTDKKHILVVDDDEMVSFALQEYLEALGYQVSRAENCDQAGMILAEKPKIDLLILDYLMPQGNGTELLRTISERNDMQRPPVIISSSILESSNPFWKALLAQLSAPTQALIQGYVSKPYSFEYMNEAVKSALNFGLSGQIISGDYLSPSPNSKAPERSEEAA
jgi:CheY-like chemotaxis protein